MKKSVVKKLLIALAIVAIIAFSALIIRNYTTKTSFKYGNGEVENLAHQAQDAVSGAVVGEAQNNKTEIDKTILEISPSEFVLGDKSAPVTIVEYASLSCPHCASFYRDAFESLKKDYIETGKVKFVYRDFPLNQPALAAAMVAVCRVSGEEENKAEIYHNFVKALFKTQDSWAFDPQYIDKLEAIAMLDGMAQETFKKCLENKKLQEKILVARMSSSKSLSINSTPTFFINGEAFEGFVDYKTIKKAIDEKLK